MRDAIAAAGAGSVVVPLGLRRDVPAILAAADVFVLSTRSEVFSVSTIEAMAAGLPVVVSDIPAFDELVTDGVEGLRVRSEDAGALAGALGRLLADGDLRRRLGQAGRARAQRLSVEGMADRFERWLSAGAKRP